MRYASTLRSRLPAALLLLLLGGGCERPPAGSPRTATSASAPQQGSAAPCTAWQPQESGTGASFRGLDAVDEDVVWVSGTGGTWGRTLDGGATWRTGTVPGAGELDFRDVDAFSVDVAYLMSAGPGELSRIFKTVDGGASWELQHTNPWPEGFFDGMAFWDADRGIVYGDPVGGHFLVLTTADGGATWERVAAEVLPPAFDGEAGFAASGTGIAVGSGGTAWFGTGGAAARVFRTLDFGRTWTVAETPLASGESSAGIFSLAFRDPAHGVAVGGDYTKPEDPARNAAVTRDGGLTWTLVEGSPPAGYRSAVAWFPGSPSRHFLAVGTSGSDLSHDDGASWTALAGDGYNAVALAGPCAGWAAGPDGRIARLER